jgi:hypothetical protein
VVIAILVYKPRLPRAKGGFRKGYCIDVENKIFGGFINVTVQYFQNDTMVASVSDLNTTQSFSSPFENASGYDRTSAEWITEAPASGSRILPLANFGVSYYGQYYTTVGNTNYATVNGVYGAIGSFAYTSITMVSHNGTPKAVPSALTSDGTSFYVSYQSSIASGKLGHS